MASITNLRFRSLVWQSPVQLYLQLSSWWHSRCDSTWRELRSRQPKGSRPIPKSWTWIWKSAGCGRRRRWQKRSSSGQSIPVTKSLDHIHMYEKNARDSWIKSCSHQKRREHVLDPGSRVTARDADEELEGVGDHGDRDRRQQRQQREQTVPREPRVHAACKETRTRMEWNG